MRTNWNVVAIKQASHQFMFIYPKDQCSDKKFKLSHQTFTAEEGGGAAGHKTIHIHSIRRIHQHRCPPSGIPGKHSATDLLDHAEIWKFTDILMLDWKSNHCRLYQPPSHAFTTFSNWSLLVYPLYLILPCKGHRSVEDTWDWGKHMTTNMQQLGRSGSGVS